MKKEQIEISVIMGVYNPKNKVQFQQAVRSIINQTFQQWEMLIYDDGSDEISGSGTCSYLGIY